MEPEIIALSIFCSMILVTILLDKLITNRYAEDDYEVFLRQDVLNSLRRATQLMNLYNRTKDIYFYDEAKLVRKIAH